MQYLLPDKVYDVLKWVCILALPVLGWAYGGLADVWSWPMADQIVRTIDIVGTALGALIGVSTIKAKFFGDPEITEVSEEEKES